MMTDRARGLLRLLHTFGGMVAFYGALWLWGLKPAIAAALSFVLIDGAWRVAARRRPPGLWIASSVLAIVAGIVDLFARTPFMIRYEATIIATLIGLCFLAGAFGPRPLLIQVAEQSGRFILPPDRPDLLAFFRALTVAWALYLFLRAGVSWWLMSHYPVLDALRLRLVFNWVSLAAMIAVSMGGRRVFALCRRLGFFRSSPSPV